MVNNDKRDHKQPGLGKPAGITCRALGLLTAVCLLVGGVLGMPVTVQAASFDPGFYAAKYPDVVAAFGTDDPQILLLHYLYNGILENRIPYEGAKPGTAVDEYLALGDGLSVVALAANLDTGTIIYGKNYTDIRYPASTTKILTALLVLQYLNPDDLMVVTEDAVRPPYLPSDSSTCGLKAGDVLTVRDALYGLMLPSGNDAANALAITVAGSVEAFAVLMNQKAAEIGCLASHFTNAHGYPDPAHFTTAADLYMILAKAAENPTFCEIAGTAKYTATIHRTSTGEVVPIEWENLNRYTNGSATAPAGIRVIAGKTGSCRAAGKCLAVFCRNEEGQACISIVMGAGTNDDMYVRMNQLLLAEK